MEEQFILRVPPAVAERIERLLNESSSSEDKNLDLFFSEDGRTGTFVVGNDHFSASLLDLPTVVESYKTYDDNVLIKTADIGQMVMVREEGDSIPETVEYRHGLTPPMRDARRRRFRREPDLNPEVVRRVEKDLQNIMAGGTAENFGVEMAEPEEYGDENVVMWVRRWFLHLWLSQMFQRLGQLVGNLMGVILMSPMILYEPWNWHAMSSTVG